MLAMGSTARYSGGAWETSNPSMIEMKIVGWFVVFWSSDAGGNSLEFLRQAAPLLLIPCGG
ncbi:uncharacterized protein N7487_009903 [Penicillium crustosum]|uniref:uncharacterized protein n=1 Tax=Penicillium crustosum TaxID=36656 RepID=UPI0023957B2B|nr:uncharacterized protein N7487_009903 [Penicillium crustosum]KAJ5395600.1 hypothetical protein N7487_009903 [Penicillium crustosum]